MWISKDIVSLLNAVVSKWNQTMRKDKLIILYPPISRWRFALKVMVYKIILSNGWIKFYYFFTQEGSLLPNKKTSRVSSQDVVARKWNYS